MNTEFNINANTKRSKANATRGKRAAASNAAAGRSAAATVAALCNSTAVYLIRCSCVGMRVFFVQRTTAHVVPVYVPALFRIPALYRAITLFNRLYNSPFFAGNYISETLISLVQMPLCKILNQQYLAQRKTEQCHNRKMRRAWRKRGRSSCSALLCLCAAAALLLHGVSVTDRRFFFCGAHVCFRVSRQHYMVLPVCDSPIYRHSLTPLPFKVGLSYICALFV